MIDEDLVVNANIGAADAGPQKTSFVSLDVNPVDYNYGDSVFNPDDPATYNYVVHESILDDLGASHQLSLYFIRQPVSSMGALDNHWHLIVMVDGYHVGDPDISLASSDDTVATPVIYTIYFDEEGEFSSFYSDSILVSNWVP